MKNIIRPLTIGIAALLLISTSYVSLAAPPHNGIEGQTFLYISYGDPIEIAPGFFVSVGDIQLPVATALTVYSSNTGREVSRVTTDASGMFSVALHPGKYVLVPDDVETFCSSLSVDPIEVTVQPREFTISNIFYFEDGPCSIGGIANTKLWNRGYDIGANLN